MRRTHHRLARTLALLAVSVLALGASPVGETVSGGAVGITTSSPADVVGQVDGSVDGDAECADDSAYDDGLHPGGEWRHFGRDLGNNRSQPQEDSIGTDNADSLTPDWAFDVDEHGSGIIHSTPIVADGCVYFGTTSGWVFAANADTGDLVWGVDLRVEDSGLLCTGVIGSTVVEDGRVFAIVSQAGAPYTAALDQKTGELLWASQIDDTPLNYNCGSPVVHDGMVISPFTGDQTGGTNRGGYAIFDVETGEELAHSYTIPEDDYADGYQGGGIWTTPAVDIEESYAYAGTANPEAGVAEHERTNAILKIDLDRERETFGQIVDSYKGDPDRPLGLPDPPSCTSDPSVDVFVRSILCAQQDIDFGAAPNVLHGPEGTRVGALQKSGNYHVADTERMEGEWVTAVAPPTFYSNGATAAFDGDSVYVAGSPPGQMVGLDADDGSYEWAAPIGDLIHYQGVAHANGLVFTNDAKGHLNVYDADTGLLVAHRIVGQDAGDQPFHASESSSSTAIARNTVYVASDRYVVAYQPDSEHDGGDGPGLPDDGPLPDDGSLPDEADGAGSSVVAGPLGTSFGYLTPEVVAVAGTGLTFANLDIDNHDVVSRDRNASGERLFASGLIGVGQTSTVAGVEDLEPGSYDFICSLHSSMTGTLHVTDPEELS